MQRLVNNWSTTLQAPLLASDPELLIPPAMAARIEERLQSEDDFCDITIHPEGESPEIVRITATGPSRLVIGERGREGTVTPVSWPAGTVLRCTATAGLLEALLAGGGGGGGIEDAPQDGDIYGRVDGGWDYIPLFNDEGVIYTAGAWWGWAPGIGVSGALRNTYWTASLPSEEEPSRKQLMVIEIDANFGPQDAGPVDFILGYTPSGFSERISPTAVTVYDANGAWELGLLYMEGSSVRLAVKTLDLTSGGAVRFAGAMPYPARSDPDE